jgi:thiol-disulfide isomerase/thioredoxin
MSPVNYLWAAAIAAIVGFAAVYWTMAPSDNGEVDIAGPAAPAANDPATGPTGAKEAPSSAEPLNTGHMATFVFKEQPEALPEISFKDASGKALTLADFKGKTVLLNLWATWCAPCREEMPALDRLQEKLGGDKFEVIALSVDRGGAQKSQEFLDQIKIKNLALYADESASATTPLKVIGMPTTLLIDAQGREIGRVVGPAEWDSADAVRLVKAHIE